MSPKIRLKRKSSIEVYTFSKQSELSFLENFESYRNLDCSISLKEPPSPLIKDSKLDLVKQIEELQAENLKLK